MRPEVDTVFVWVRDLDGSLEWYLAFGLEPGPRHGAWQEVAVSGATRFALHQGPRVEGPSTSVISFRVDDLDAEIERLSNVGIEPSDPEITDIGAARFVTFTDPDGNEIQLLER